MRVCRAVGQLYKGSLCSPYQGPGAQQPIELKMEIYLGELWNTVARVLSWMAPVKGRGIAKRKSPSVSF